MSVNNKISYHPKVSKDLKKIDYAEQQEILWTIKNKILVDPSCGKQLKGVLKNYQSLRVGNYRIVYRSVESGQIRISAIGHRKYIYETTLRRGY